MSLITVNFRSEVLQLNVAVNVILPQPPVGTRGFERKLPVLWLLHGLSDDHTIWVRRTSIERYVEGRGLAVVMPGVDRSFYADMVRGNRYWTYVSEELPSLMRAYFPLSARREDNFAAGLSMGGYGAFKLALSHPTRFAAAASLSGALQRFSGNPPADAPKEWIAELENMFGDLGKFTGSSNDIFTWRRRSRAAAGRGQSCTQCAAPKTSCTRTICASRHMLRRSGCHSRTRKRRASTSGAFGTVISSVFWIGSPYSRAEPFRSAKV